MQRSSVRVIRCSTQRLTLTLERHRDLLKRGTVLVDEGSGHQPRVLFYLEHAIQDGTSLSSGDRRSSRSRCSSRDRRRRAIRAMLITRPISTTGRCGGRAERRAILARPEFQWITKDLEQKALEPRHRRSRSGTSRGGARTTDCAWIEKAGGRKGPTHEGDRLLGPSRRGLKLQEQAGKPNARLNSQRGAEACRRTARRLEKRMDDSFRSDRSRPFRPSSWAVSSWFRSDSSTR